MFLTICFRKVSQTHLTSWNTAVSREMLMHDSWSREGARSLWQGSCASQSSIIEANRWSRSTEYEPIDQRPPWQRRPLRGKRITKPRGPSAFVCLLPVRPLEPRCYGRTPID
jgi:hypothetical protein